MDLRRTHTIRERAGELLALARQGRSEHFTVHDEALDEAAACVAEVTRQRYPDLRIPYHSRWRHFEAGGVDRRAWMDEALATQDPHELARARFDLTVSSVLLDAGAGATWRYEESRSGQSLARSEGLGVASLHAMASGLFSADPARPWRCEARALARLEPADLARAFQASDTNPLVGLEGRTELLRRLGQAMAAQPATFGPDGRPGGMYDVLTQGRRAPVAAHEVLSLLLDTLSGIWPQGQWRDGVPLGDCWPCEVVAGGWMPFHKLSQWLTYSLLEPLQWAGVEVTGLDELTGLPEYRNGGLLLDSGVLRLRDPASATRAHRPGDPLVVHWRALTVALLDELAPRVRSLLGRTAQQMPLACVLEGGTWAAGRVLAQRLRGGDPPLRIESDGTVF